MRTWPSRNCVIIAPKWGVPNGNHMNDDVPEVNGSAPPMLPGSFLHKKEPGYEARVECLVCLFICLSVCLFVHHFLGCLFVRGIFKVSIYLDR